MKILHARASYPDNLAGHRHEGHAPPVMNEEKYRVVAELLDDPLYVLNLRRRLRKGIAGAIEVWLWRWKLGDPKRAEQTTDESDRKRFAALRSEVRELIRDRPAEHAELEDRILGELPAGEPVDVEQVPEEKPDA